MEHREIPPLTTHEISRYIHVDFKTVINWCEQGKLPAYKTLGGHRRVRPESFMEFLTENKLPVHPEFAKRMKGALSILVVDDEEKVRLVILRMLKRIIPQAQLYEAQDGFEAGRLVSDTLPYLVILDLNLPGIDGFRVCANIRKDERLNETRILAITGQDTEENKKRILEAGASDFLAKPFDGKQLTEKVSCLLELFKG